VHPVVIPSLIHWGWLLEDENPPRMYVDGVPVDTLPPFEAAPAMSRRGDTIVVRGLPPAHVLGKPGASVKRVHSTIRLELQWANDSLAYIDIRAHGVALARWEAWLWPVDTSVTRLLVLQRLGSRDAIAATVILPVPKE